MRSPLVRSVIIFISYTLLQVIFARNLVVGGKAFTLIYLMFILLLPLETGRGYLLLLGFLSGFVVDLFYNSGGIHAAATVFIAFIRPFWINVNVPRGGYELGVFPNMKNMGLTWFITYTLPLLFLHILLLFYLEASTFRMFWFTLGRVVLSTILSFVVIIMLQYLFHSKQRVI